MAKQGGNQMVRVFCKYLGLGVILYGLVACDDPKSAESVENVVEATTDTDSAGDTAVEDTGDSGLPGELRSGGCPGSQVEAHLDADGDHYGRPAYTCKFSVNLAANEVTVGGDCADRQADVYPGAAEVCNEKDDDCDGQINEGLVMNTYYYDYDTDGYGLSAQSQVDCRAEGKFRALVTGDCDDGVHSTNPGAAETCNGVDDDCDSLVDDGLAFITQYYDTDGDGYGASNTTRSVCSSVTTDWRDKGNDCNEADVNIHPNVPEAYNSVDDDCDGKVDESGWIRFCFTNVQPGINYKVYIREVSPTNMTYWPPTNSWSNPLPSQIFATGSGINQVCAIFADRTVVPGVVFEINGWDSSNGRMLVDPTQNPSNTMTAAASQFGSDIGGVSQAVTGSGIRATVF